MNHLEEITEGLMEVFRGLKSRDLEAKDAVEINNTAGKIISAYKTRIAYAALRGDTPMIEGLETTPKTAKLAGAEKTISETLADFDRKQLPRDTEDYSGWGGSGGSVLLPARKKGAA